MTFQTDIDVANISGRPFRVEHDGGTKKSSVVFLSGEEIAAAQQARVAEAARKQAKSDATITRLQRLRALPLDAGVIQFIEDELL